MGVYLVTATFDHDSGLPEDRAVNTFHFDMTEVASTPVDSGNVLDMIEDFYGATPAGDTDPLRSLLSTRLTGGFVIRGYRLADPSPRVVKFDRTVAGQTGSGNALPEEVALCLSLKAAPLAGSVPARRRGRVYIGPLVISGAVIDGDGQPAVAGRTRLARAGRDLIAASGASANNKLVVYSRVNNSAAEIVEGWVDNAFDTQRRRGVAATSRIIVTDALPA